MKPQSSDFSVEYDSLGRVELDLYLARARQQRSAYLGALLGVLVERIRHSLHALVERLQCVNCQTSH
jgi:hypothetical protein